jgi:hypothetical protein
MLFGYEFYATTTKENSASFLVYSQLNIRPTTRTLMACQCDLVSLVKFWVRKAQVDNEALGKLWERFH